MTYYELTNIHTHSHIQTRSQGSQHPRGGDFFEVSLKVTAAHSGREAQTGHVNMCRKGHLRLHGLAHHPWRLPSTQPITAKDSVMQCPSYWRDS